MLNERSHITFDEALLQYQTLFLASRNLAQRTRDEYSNDLTDLCDFLRDQAGLKTCDQVEKRHLDGYLAELDRRGLSGNTRRRKVASIRSFFALLTELRIVLIDPAHKLIPPERDYHQPRVLTETEYRRLLAVVRSNIRDFAIVELLLQTGMRLSELTRLTLQDFELPDTITRDPNNAGSVHILGKGRKERTVTLNWKACAALRAYLAIRPTVQDTHLFITKFGQGISPRGVEYLVEKYLQAANLVRASVHTLRHTFATHHVRQGTKLDVVRQALGHESLKTTSIYVDLARDMMDKELQTNAL